jgi:hypothetical protein
MMKHGSGPLLRKKYNASKDSFIHPNRITETVITPWKALYKHNPDKVHTKRNYYTPQPALLKVSDSHAKDSLNIKVRMVEETLNQLFRGHDTPGWKLLYQAVRNIPNNVSVVHALIKKGKDKKTSNLLDCRGTFVEPVGVKIASKMAPSLTGKLRDFVRQHHSSQFGNQNNRNVKSAFDLLQARIKIKIK